MTRDMIDNDNWILGSSFEGTDHHPSAFSQPPSTPPPLLPRLPQMPLTHMSSSSDQLAQHHQTGSPAMSDAINSFRPSSAESSRCE